MKVQEPPGPTLSGLRRLFQYVAETPSTNILFLFPSHSSLFKYSKKLKFDGCKYFQLSKRLLMGIINDIILLLHGFLKAHVE